MAIILSKTCPIGLSLCKTKEVNALDELKTMCDDAKEVHNSLMALLSVEEGGKDEIWFKAKMLPNNE